MPFSTRPVLYLSSTSIGRKLLMAVTGVLLIGFLFAHVAGNLQIFEGPEKINAYGAMLREMPMLLWTARGGLLVVFLVHVFVAFQLRAGNRDARREPYAFEATVQATVASRYMLETGLVVFFFVLIHLMHYTLGLLQPEYFHILDSKGRHDVYSMVVHGFLNPAFAGAYIFAMLMLGMHLSHAISSLLQTLGWYSTYSTPVAQKAGRVIAWLLVVAYISIPVAVQLGFLRLSGTVAV